MIDNIHCSIPRLFKFKMCLFLLIFAIYLFFSSSNPWTEAHRQFQVSRNLIRNYSLSIEKPIHVLDIKGRNGRYYDCHGLTNILIMAPIALFEPVFHKVLNKDKDIERLMLFLEVLTGLIVNSLVCLVFFSVLFLLDRPLKICFYSTLCLAFLTIIFPYATKNYEGNLNMLFILSSLYFLFALQERKKICYLIWCGYSAGLAINTREFSWLFLFCVIIFIFYISWVRRETLIAVIFLSVLIPFLVLWGYYNWLRTGFYYLTPIAAGILTGKYGVVAPTQSIVLGLKGLILSKGGNIFVYSPILLFSFLGWKKFFQTRKKECILILSIVVIFLLANAKLPGWFGLWCWGSRYTLEITPLMLLPLGYWFRTNGLRRNRIVKYIFTVICIYSSLIQLAGTLTNWQGRLWYLLERKGGSVFLFTARYSQWWDSIKTLFINLWNLMLGSFLYLENPGYDLRMSDASLYASKTVFTWWNMLLFIGINPFWIELYFILTLVVISYCLFYIANFVRQER